MREMALARTHAPSDPRTTNAPPSAVRASGRRDGNVRYADGEPVSTLTRPLMDPWIDPGPAVTSATEPSFIGVPRRAPQTLQVRGYFPTSGLATRLSYHSSPAAARGRNPSI